MAYNKEELKKKFEPILKEINDFENPFAGNQTTKKKSGNERDPLEASTENILINPFIEIFGYNNRSLSAPNRVESQHTIGKGKVDLALFREGELSIIVESKAFKYDLDEKHYDQLRSYFNLADTKITFAILTNGLDYKFYSDFENNNNKLDKDTFFEFNIKNDLNNDAKLETLYKIMHDVDKDVAKEEKIYNRAKQFITENIFNKQSDEFIRIILEFAKDKGYQLHEGKAITTGEIERLKQVITRIFEERLKEQTSQVQHTNSNNTNSKVIVNAKIPNITNAKEGKGIDNLPNNTTFYCNSSGINAKCLYKDSQFILLAGSIIRTRSGEFKTLESDEYFKAPSGAAVKALGRNSNGWNEWKDASGKTLDEIAKKI